MSILTIEATPEEMKQEAVNRMCRLGLGDDVIEDFENHGCRKVSDHISGKAFLHEAEEAMERQIASFEKEYDSLVYHVIVSHTALIGDMLAFLFVSPTSSDWPSECQFIGSGMVCAYVLSDIEEAIGDITVKKQNGALIRTA